VPKKRQTQFGDYLDELLEARGYSVRSFARKVKVPPSTISTAKRETLNTEWIAGWADALKLTGGERYRFYFLAHLAHTTPWLQREVNRLVRQVGERGLKYEHDP